MTVIKNGTVFMPDGSLIKTDIELENGLVKAVGEASDTSSGNIIDAEGLIVSPGFIDIHIHGANGADFSDGSVESIDRMAEYLLRQGVTAFLGTTMSLGEEALAAVMETAAPLVGKIRAGRAVLWGINMEGPFFAMSKKGGQNGKYIRNPDLEMFKRLYEKSGGSIRLVDLAPELNGSLEFIEKVKSLCKISLAHTEADYEIAMKAFKKGATHVTHLFNAMPPVNHRNPGIIVAAAEEAEFVELICDGKHVHPAVVRFAFRMFTGERVCIISDGMRACGLNDGEYELGGLPVYVEGDRAVLKDDTLAGSTTNAAEGVRRAIRFGVPVKDALRAATANPAKAAGLEHILGSLAPGKRADILLLDNQFNVRSVFLEGNRQY